MAEDGDFGSRRLWVSQWSQVPLEMGAHATPADGTRWRPRAVAKSTTGRQALSSHFFLAQAARTSPRVARISLSKTGQRRSVASDVALFNGTLLGNLICTGHSKSDILPYLLIELQIFYSKGLLNE